MIEITFRGRGGQGAFTASKIIGNACVKQDNLYSLAFPTFGPERRGAPVSAFTKIDTKKSKTERKCKIQIIWLYSTNRCSM